MKRLHHLLFFYKNIGVPLTPRSLAHYRRAERVGIDVSSLFWVLTCQIVVVVVVPQFLYWRLRGGEINVFSSFRSSISVSTTTGSCNPCGKKYVLLCAACGGLAIVLGSLFAVLYVVLRSYTSSLHYFETVPSYVASVAVITITNSNSKIDELNQMFLFFQTVDCYRSVDALLRMETQSVRIFGKNKHFAL